MEKQYEKHDNDNDGLYATMMKVAIMIWMKF